MRKEYEKENFIWKFISLTLLLLAFFLAVRDGLCIDWWSSRDLFFTCLLVSAFVTVSGYHRWARIAGGLLGVLVEGSMLWFHRAEIWKELRYCYHRVIPLVNDYYDTFYQYDIRQRHGDIQTLIFVIAIPVGVLLGLGIRRGRNKSGRTGRWRILFFLPLVAAFSCGFMLGYGPGFWAVLCLLLGLAFRLLLSDGQESAWKQKEDCLMFLCLCGAIGLSALCYQPLSQNALHYHRQMREFQTFLEESLKDIGNGGSFFSGLRWKLGWYDNTATLTNREPKLTKDRIFTVTVDKKPDFPLYFKTFVGGDYDNGVWYSAGENGFEEYCQSRGLDSQALGAAVLTQNGSIGMSYRPKPWNMTVQLLKRNGELSPYPYYPWGVSLPEEAQVVGDRGIRYNKSNSYQLKMGREREDQFSSLSSSVILDEGSAGEEYRIPLEIVEIVETPTPLGDYQDYVEDVYTRLPEGQLSRLREAYDTGSLFDRTILEAMMKENYYVSDISVKWILGDYLDENFQYSMDLSPVPKGEDIVEYFLLDQKKGYCMHFASAVTLLYRMMGIPARYVSGYIVTPGDFVRNGDGTYTATVTGMRAHAWVETYNSSDGWSNDEVTPPDFREGLWSAGAGDSPRDIIAALEREDRPEYTPSDPNPDTPDEPDEPSKEEPDSPPNNVPTKKPQPNQPTQNSGRPEETQRPGGILGLGIGFGTGNKTVDMVLTVVCYFLFAVLLLGLVILLFFLRYRLIWDRRLRSFRDTDEKKAAAAIVRETFRLLRISGIFYTGREDDAVFAAEAEKKLLCMETGEFTAFIEIACAARYGGSPLAEQQRSYLLMIYKRLCSYEKEQLNIWQRFWYRIVLVKI